MRMIFRLSRRPRRLFVCECMQELLITPLVVLAHMRDARADEITSAARFVNQRFRADSLGMQDDDTAWQTQHDAQWIARHVNSFFAQTQPREHERQTRFTHVARPAQDRFWIMLRLRVNPIIRHRDADRQTRFTRDLITLRPARAAEQTGKPLLKRMQNFHDSSSSFLTNVRRGKARQNFYGQTRGA